MSFYLSSLPDIYSLYQYIPRFLTIFYHVTMNQNLSLLNIITESVRQGFLLGGLLLNAQMKQIFKNTGCIFKVKLVFLNLTRLFEF